MTRLQGIVLFGLAALVLASGIGVVYAKYQSRVLFIDLQKLRAERDNEDAEWGRLQLEVATRGSLEQVQQAAGARLQMRMPRAEDIVVVD